MKVRKYNDFDEMFLKLNQEILLHPHEMIDYCQGAMGFMDNIFIACKSWECNLDLSVFGYAKTKWGYLLRTYIDYDKLLEFRDKLKNTTALSLTYNFKQKQINNGSCLIAIVLTRKDRKKEWTKCNVLYRTTETQRRMAADLCLIHHFIKELPECCKIERVTFYMSQCYCHACFINGFYDYFKVDYDELTENHPWTKCLLMAHQTSYTPGGKISTYQSMAKMQKLCLGEIKYKPLPCNELSITEWFEKRK